MSLAVFCLRVALGSSGGARSAGVAGGVSTTAALGYGFPVLAGSLAATWRAVEDATGYATEQAGETAADGSDGDAGGGRTGR